MPTLFHCKKNRIFMYKPNIQYFLDWTIWIDRVKGRWCPTLCRGKSSYNQCHTFTMSPWLPTLQRHCQVWVCSTTERQRSTRQHIWFKPMVQRTKSAGLMLVVHSILFVGYGLNILDDPDINHILTITALSILLCCTWFTGIVYKNTAFNILETSFILNLIILSGWTIYNRRTSNGNSLSDGQTALVCTSTGVAFSTFIFPLLAALTLGIEQEDKTARRLERLETMVKDVLDRFKAEVRGVLTWGEGAKEL